MSYHVCIPTAGTGSRLGDLTRHINKSLVSVANKPVITHLIDQFPKDVVFVIALGYKGDLLREFLELVYPNRNFLFCNVDNFEGPGSGLGYSLLCCKEHLQTPFVFCSCDTMTKTGIPEPSHNWMGYAYADDIRPYRTLRVADGAVKDICEKGLDLAYEIGIVYQI